MAGPDAHDPASPPFERLDFVYIPTRDVSRDLEYYERVVGARVGFAIEAFGTRVAMVRAARHGPDLLLAGHLAGERPVLVFRVGDLEREVERLTERGFEAERHFEIPHGPGCAFTTPAGHRLAVYELTRPQAGERLAGRRDF